VEGSSATGSIVLLTRLARVVYRRSAEELLGIRLKDLAALAYLREHGPVTQQSVGDALCVDANSCVLLLNELESAGLVERRRDPVDRRRHIVEMTTPGRRALERAERAQESIEEDVLGSLSIEQRAMLRELLHRALEGTPAETPAAAALR
jgi:DNA-binding MarR family transcriptional regulator